MPLIKQSITSLDISMKVSATNKTKYHVFIVCVNNLKRTADLVLWFPDKTSVCTLPWAGRLYSLIVLKASLNPNNQTNTPDCETYLSRSQGVFQITLHMILYENCLYSFTLFLQVLSMASSPSISAEEYILQMMPFLHKRGCVGNIFMFCLSSYLSSFAFFKLILLPYHIYTW